MTVSSAHAQPKVVSAGKGVLIFLLGLSGLLSGFILFGLLAWAMGWHYMRGRRENRFVLKAPLLLKNGMILGIVSFGLIFFVGYFSVPSGAMENEIWSGDYILVNRTVYGVRIPPISSAMRDPIFTIPGYGSVKRGDIIVFKFPGQRDEVVSPEFTLYLKRCIALGGDTVQIRDRHVYVNGQHLEFPRNVKFNSPHIVPAGVADPRIFPKGEPYNEDNWGPVVIPKKGDAIPLSAENVGRWRTFMEREDRSVVINGQGRFTVDGETIQSYTVRRDYVFGMGDNRDNSLDGRFWGFIPKDDIVGTALIVYWSWDPDISIFTDPIAKLGTIRFNRIGTLVR